MTAHRLNSAEAAVIRRSTEGVRTHDMTGGWRVIVAKHGEHHATWYYHINDDARIASALESEAQRRLAMWEARAALGNGESPADTKARG